MVCFYERGGDRLRCEVRRRGDREPKFELVVIEPDGSERVEEFATRKDLEVRAQQLERALVSRGWHGPLVVAA